MKRFIDLAELELSEIHALLRLAGRLEHMPEPDALRGRVLGLLFMNPSLRTLASFQSGMARLGGSSFVVTPGQGTWQLEWRPGVTMNGTAAEHVREAIPVLASYADVLGIRLFASGTHLTEDLEETAFQTLADLCPVPLINLESAVGHPCQALADWKTLDDLQISSRGRFVLSWANHPKALPMAVPAAVLHMAALRGMDVTVLRPEAYALPPSIMDKARWAASLSGGSVRETDQRAEALEGAQVIYAKSWGSAQLYGDAAAETLQRASLNDWCVSEGWFETARTDCRFMHCLPVRRNVVVRDEVLDGPRAVVLRQAQNRLWVQMAVLKALMSP